MLELIIFLCVQANSSQNKPVADTKKLVQSSTPHPSPLRTADLDTGLGSAHPSPSMTTNHKDDTRTTQHVEVLTVQQSLPRECSAPPLIPGTSSEPQTAVPHLEATPL